MPGVTESVPFALLLKHHRTAKGLTQEQLAERAGLSVRGISALERGINRHPRLITVRLLADALDLGPEDQAELRVAAAGPSPAETSDRHMAAGPARPIGGFLGALPARPLVGRQTELRQLEDIVLAAAEGHGQTVLVSGEHGIGKTRLAQEAFLSLRDHGFVVAAGRCYEPDQTVPLLPFAEVYATLYRHSPADLRDQCAQRWPHLASLFLEEEPATVSPAEDPEERQRRLLRAATGLLSALAERERVAILLDDLHWADSASLALFRSIARLTPGSPMVLLGSYRPTAARGREPLADTLSDLVREGLMREISLGCLSLGETRELVAMVTGRPAASDEMITRVHARTDGNPFLTHELARSIAEHGTLLPAENASGDGPQDIGVPASVRLVINHRVSRLSATAQEVLGESCVLGQAFSFDDLVRMSARPELQVEQALEESVGAGLVHEAGAEGYVFDHVLTQEVLYGQLPVRRRQRLHFALAEAVERLPERVRARQAAHIAWHFLKSHRPERALEHTLQAGDRAEAMGAHAEAARHYRDAAFLAEQAAEDRKLAEALEKFASALMALEQSEESLHVLERAAGLYHRLGDDPGEERVQQALARGVAAPDRPPA